MSVSSLKAEVKDSGMAKPIGLRLLGSFNPLIQTQFKNTPSLALYSKAYYELQYSRNKHCIGIGYFKNQPATVNYINNIKITKDILTQSFSASYTYKVFDKFKIDMYAGLNYCFYQVDSLNIAYSSKENQTERGLRTIKSYSAVFRTTYNFNRFIGLTLETPISFIKVDYQYNKEYPLTPSLNSYRSEKFNTKRIIIPSNIYLRISI